MIPEGSIISGFISKVISDCIDISKQAIKKADNSRKSTQQTLQTRIYQVIIDVLNRITNNTYKNQELIYITAEKILNGFKNNDGNVIEAIRTGLNIINNSVSNDECKDFLNILCEEISNEKNISLYKEILLLLQQTNEQNYILLKQITEQLEQINRKLNKEEIEREKVENQHEKKFQKNKKQKYIDTWNSRLFLQPDNEENLITLSNAFITPNYKIYDSIKRIKFSNNDILNKIINKFIQYNRTSTMVIMGVPGIGKSTMTSWIANEYKNNDNVIILRFRDWSNNQLKDGLLNAIYNVLCCEKEDLENKVLVLDGFDEVKYLDKRDYLLNTFLNNIKDFENIKVIITSRSAYINSTHFQNVIELQVFDIDKVEKFYKKITNKDLIKKEQIKSNLEVLGIPVILYMAIMSDVDISENPTKPELYNRIFAEKGGIFDKFDQYDNGDQLLRNPENTKKYLAFLQEIAFKMFEKNKLILNKEEYEIPQLEFNGNYINILEFPIKHLFENTESNIEFIHKSIYEYFVSEYIFISINQEINKKSSNKELAKILGSVLIKNHLSYEILEFLDFKIRNSKLNYLFDTIKNVFNLMLKDGMTYYTEKCYKNVIDCEMNIFANMLELIHLWERKLFRFNNQIVDYIKHNYKLCLNLKAIDLTLANLTLANLTLADLTGANLTGANLTGADLTQANLIQANLTGANLTGANLIKANLIQANLIQANLTLVDLTKANLIQANLTQANLIQANLTLTNLTGANLIQANLIQTNLIQANLTQANLIQANLTLTNLTEVSLNNTIFSQTQIEYFKQSYNFKNSVVYIEKTKEIISYKEYCKRKQKN